MQSTGLCTVHKRKLFDGGCRGGARSPAQAKASRSQGGRSPVPEVSAGAFVALHQLSRGADQTAWLTDLCVVLHMAIGVQYNVHLFVLDVECAMGLKTTLVLGRKKSRHAAELEASQDLPSREALTTRLESQRLALLQAMACVHLARCTLEEHGMDAQHREVLPFKTEQHGAYQRRVLEALGVAGDALASAYPMLERIAQALDAGEMLKAHRVEPPPARKPASRTRRAS